jgi:hypothetical protein
MTENGAGGQATERLARRRGIGFPVVPLPETVTILRKAGKHGQEYSMNAFAGYAGHSTSNSGSFKRRLASFRDFGLIVGASGDRVVLTDLGRRVAFPTDPEKERRDLQEAFQNCDLFMRVWDDSAKGVPVSLSTLANLGVQLGVAPVSKERFAESLSQSAVTAGYAEQAGERISFVRPEERKASFDALFETPGVFESRAREALLGEALPRQKEARPPQERVLDEEEEHGPTPIGSSERPMDDPVDFKPDTPVPGAGWRKPEAPREKTGEVISPGQPAKPEELISSPGPTGGMFYQQSWVIGAGSLSLEIRLQTSLPMEAFAQIGRVMAEAEKLKKILAEGAEAGAESGEPR